MAMLAKGSVEELEEREPSRLRGAISGPFSFVTFISRHIASLNCQPVMCCFQLASHLFSIPYAISVSIDTASEKSCLFPQIFLK